MSNTRNNLTQDTRESIYSLLQSRVFDGIDILFQVKQAHWNVKGQSFIALHELFDKIHEEMENSIDLMAERIVQLGGLVEGTCQAVAKKSSIPDYPGTIVNEQDTLESLSNSLASYGKVVYQGVKLSGEWGDYGSSDILTQVLRSVDKNLWLIESHLMGRPYRSGSLTGVA